MPFRATRRMVLRWQDGRWVTYRRTETPAEARDLCDRLNVIDLCHSRWALVRLLAHRIDQQPFNRAWMRRKKRMIVRKLG